MTIISITQLRIIPWQGRELKALLAALLSALRPGRLRSDRGGGPGQLRFSVSQTGTRVQSRVQCVVPLLPYGSYLTSRRSQGILVFKV